MYQKYVKNILITSAILVVAWANTYVLYANKKKVEDMSFEVKALQFELDQSKQNESKAEEALDEAKKQFEELVSQRARQKEEALKAVAVSTTPRPATPPVQQPPIVTSAPIIPKPTIVKVTKPSRSTRAS